MNNNEQVYYVQYRQSDGYLTVMTDQDHYNKLANVEKQKYTQVIVDLKHLNGWGRYWNHCRYINKALSYPDNYPKDQSVQIADLKKQLSDIIASNNDKEKSNQDLVSKLNEANEKIMTANKQIDYLGQLSTSLQAQLAHVRDHEAAVANNQPSVASSAAAQSNKGGNR